MTVNVYTPTLPLVVSTDYTFPIALLDQGDTKIFQTSPTLASGDFILYRKASSTWTRIGNLTTTPALISGGTRVVLVTVLAAELPAGTQAIAIECADAADAEWCDLLIIKDVEVAAAVGTSDLVQEDILSDATPFAGATVSTLTASQILYTALTESYSTNGATKTVAQALYEIVQFLHERAVADVTVTVDKLDGTTAMTFTLDDAVTPTSIQRTT